MNVIKVDVPAESDDFWNAVKIYYQHPNSINKQVLFSEDNLIIELQSFVTLNECEKLFHNFCFKLSEGCTIRDFVKSTEFSEYNGTADIFSLSNRMFLLLRRLRPKFQVNDKYDFFEFIFLDIANTKVYIFTKNILKTCSEKHNSFETKNQDPFAILKFNFLQLICHNKCLEIYYDRGLNEKGVTWLHATFVPKFIKLMSKTDICNIKNKNLNKLEIQNKVDIVQYYQLYEKMKLKYATYFVENWTENSDPKKCVYEDIGIATYLMMLWSGGKIPEKNSKKQKFVDLGCGNGLLVHILNSEGHLGIGIDIRKRKIWDMYPPTTILQEKIIIPNDIVYPEADWLIGNHSDELTAWIPIIAKLSSGHCQYFALPCCPYQINGMKFQRKNNAFSSYQDFIHYVKDISQLCDFETSIDKLRIPSTKRICLIGLTKPQTSEENYILVKKKITGFIREECQSYNHKESDNGKSTLPGDQEAGTDKVSLKLKIRESKEPVRNCTRLPQEFIERVLKIVMNELLKEKVTCTVIKNGQFFVWNRGRKTPIRELVSCLDTDLLKHLKNECKGLQTLLKNHHFLFEVSQGYVQFRSPENMLELCKKFLENHTEKWKIRKCWFFFNHPDKCPLSDDVCSYSHCK